MPHTVVLAREDDWDGWRAAARTLVHAGIAPEDVVWQIGERPADLFSGAPIAGSPRPSFHVARDFTLLASHAILHRDPERFALLHGLLLRVIARPETVRDRAHPQTRKIEALFQTIRKDMHQMRAFIRFRALTDADGPRHVAWFEPEHHILRANAAFFVERFGAMRWSILTPEISLHWDTRTLREGPGADRATVPADDPVAAIWAAYYAATFNPSRLRPTAMLKEMPKKYWRNLPETALVPDLIADARRS